MTERDVADGAAPRGRQSRRKMRRQFRQLRRELSARAQREHATAVARAVVSSRLLLACRRIALYWPEDGELDTTPLMMRLFDYGKQLALPVLDGHRLRFYRYRADTPLVPNRFNIPEPHEPGSRPLQPATIDVVFAPLVAFDARGFRLGMGGGFYDRTFAHDRPGDSLHRWRRPMLVGLAHQLQQAETVPSADWDVPMDAVVTERGYVAFTDRGRRFRR